MTTSTRRYTGMGAVAVTLLWLAATISGCATQQAAKEPAAVEAPAQVAARIVGIVADADADVDRIRIMGSEALVFSSVKKKSPPGVVLYFPKTELALERVSLDALEASPVVAEVRTSAPPADVPTARVDILLAVDVPYEANRDGNDLVLVFARPTAAPAMAAAAPEGPATPAETTAAVPSGPPGTRMESITAQRLEDGVEIRIAADGPIRDYASFTLRDPDRIVYDLYGLTTFDAGEQTIAVGAPWVERVRYYGDSEKLRVVLDTDSKNFQATSAVPIEDGLLIHVGQAAADLKEASTRGSQGDAAIAWVNRIDFSAEDSGKSVVIVGTSRPVTFQMEKLSDQRLQLRLEDARIPGFRRRPLVTTRFNSAVDRITPVESDRLKDTALIAIELREAVPYAVEQVDNLLLVNFEPSTVPPKPEAQAELPEWQQVVDESLSSEATMKAAVPRTGAAAAGGDVMTPAGVYTGEKIALDFYDTDIKNVFRILREVSGKNFAIDKDVRGSVTLTLDKPVPWDQVLDLILKMNQLGMTYEGDIIRIATLTTLQKEETLRQETISAEQKSMEQQAALEPLVTEYIAINYSNAKADILPHLQNLITKDRGAVSVHDATNQIIIKDTAAKIAEARKLVHELDKVTPQVLIEARIVEATKSFSRQLGVQFGVGPGTGNTFVSDALGGDWDLSLSSNFPKGSGSGVSFDFSRLVGSPISINAAIDASETEGDSKTISAPRVLTLDNKAATIKQGTSYPINKLDADGNSTTEFKDIVLELQVTPHVTLDKRVSLKIKVTKNDLGAAVGNNFSFTVNEADTELLVNDGDTVVIGGITKTNETTGETGLPGLRKIPLIGWLFGSDTDTTGKNELLIFITPRIVNLEESR